MQYVHMKNRDNKFISPVIVQHICTAQYNNTDICLYFIQDIIDKIMLPADEEKTLFSKLDDQFSIFCVKAHQILSLACLCLHCILPTFKYQFVFFKLVPALLGLNCHGKLSSGNSTNLKRGGCVEIVPAFWMMD